MSNTPKINIGAELGNIYYTWNDERNDFDMYRIVSIQNSETVSCIINNDWKQKKKFNLKELRQKYTQLLSDAILTVSDVIAITKRIGNNIIPLYDVMVMVYKREGLSLSGSVPDILLRQATSDMFYQPFVSTEENPMIGFCATKETLPAEYEMNELTLVDDVLSSMIINTYKIDTIDSICQIIGNKFNSILEDLMDAHLKAVYGQSWDFMKDTIEVPEHLHGYCKDLKTLLKINNFMYDFYQILGITNVTFQIDCPDDGYEHSLPNDQRESLQEIYQINMAKTMVLPFDFSVNLEEVKVPYVLIMDVTGNLYFVAFTRSEFEYVKHVDTTLIENMTQINQKVSNAVNFYQKYSE